MRWWFHCQMAFMLSSAQCVTHNNNSSANTYNVYITYQRKQCGNCSKIHIYWTTCQIFTIHHLLDVCHVWEVALRRSAAFISTLYIIFLTLCCLFILVTKMSCHLCLDQGGETVKLLEGHHWSYSMWFMLLLGSIIVILLCLYKAWRVGLLSVIVRAAGNHSTMNM